MMERVFVGAVVATALMVTGLFYGNRSALLFPIRNTDFRNLGCIKAMNE